MDPAVAFPALHHLALIVVIIIALVTKRTKVSCRQDMIFVRSSADTHTLKARGSLAGVLRKQLSEKSHRYAANAVTSTYTTLQTTAAKITSTLWNAVTACPCSGGGETNKILSAISFTE